MLLLSAGLLLPACPERRSLPITMSGGLGSLSSKGTSWGSVEQDMLGRLGLSDADAEPTQAPPKPPLPDPAPPPPPAPRSGTQPWGRWSHEGDSIELDIRLPEGARGKDVTCEVAEGWLCVQVAQAQIKGEPPLLFGRLALPVDRTELMWGVELDDDDERFLCIELPLLPVDPRAKARVDCIFDESLTVNGEACLAPGLSQGTITLQLPEELR